MLKIYTKNINGIELIRNNKKEAIAKLKISPKRNKDKIKQFIL